MAHKVVVDLDSVAKDAEVEVLYLGMFANGHTHDLTDTQVAQYEAASRQKFPESGYLFCGQPKTDAQREAYKANAEAKEDKPQEMEPATQIAGGYSDSLGNSVESNQKDADKKEGEK